MCVRARAIHYSVLFEIVLLEHYIFFICLSNLPLSIYSPTVFSQITLLVASVRCADNWPLATLRLTDEPNQSAPAYKRASCDRPSGYPCSTGGTTKHLAVLFFKRTLKRFEEVHFALWSRSYVSCLSERSYLSPDKRSVHRLESKTRNLETYEQFKSPNSSQLSTYQQNSLILPLTALEECWETCWMIRWTTVVA